MRTFLDLSPATRWTVAGTVAFVIGVSSSHFSYTPDDAYIYFQYAKNILRGQGVSFNAGEPSYGITGPLWLLFSVVVGMPGVPIPLGAKLLDILFAAGTIVVAARFARCYTADERLIRYSIVAIGANAWFLRWAGSGMEVSAAVFFALLAFSLMLERKYIAASAAVGALMLLRPEAGLIIPLLVVDLFRSNPPWRPRVNQFLKVVGTTLGVVLPWIMYASLTFGTPVPNTARGKAGFQLTVSEAFDTLSDIGRTIATTDVLPVISLFILVAAALGGRFMRRDRVLGENPIGRPTVLALSWFLVIVLYYAVSGTNVVSRYLLIVTVPLVPPAFVAVNALLAPLKRTSTIRRTVLALCAILALQNQLFYHLIVRPGIEAFDRGMETGLMSIGRWIRDNTDPNERLIIGDIGAVAFVSDRYICDAAGLVTPRGLDYLREGYHSYDVIRDRRFTSYCSVNYIVHKSKVPRELTYQGDLDPLAIFPFSNMSLTDSTTYWYTIYRVAASVPD